MGAFNGAFVGVVVVVVSRQQKSLKDSISDYSWLTTRLSLFEKMFVWIVRIVYRPFFVHFVQLFKTNLKVLWKSDNNPLVGI